MKKTLLALILIVALLTTCFVGCSSVANNGVNKENADIDADNTTDSTTSDLEALKAAAAAVFTLDVNPGVRVCVKADNTVITVEATNEDEREINLYT